MFLIKKSHLIALLALSFLLSSCDPVAFWEFNVANNSTQPVRINFQADLSHLPDSTFLLQPGEERLIIEFEEIGGEAFDMYTDSIYAFEYIEAFQNDSVPTISNLKSRQVWDFNELEKRRSEYRLNLVDDSF